MSDAPPTPRVSSCLSLWLLSLSLSASLSASQSVTLAWDANTEPDLDGYYLYYGTASGEYGDPLDVGDVVTAAIPGLEAGTYYIVVTAYNNDGLESAASNEVTFTAPALGFSTWLVENASALGTETEPSDNPEADEYDNALEYALMLDPGSGVNNEPFCVEIDSASGKIEASFRRPVGGAGDVTYSFEVVSDPTAAISWSVWAGPAPTVDDNEDGSETVTFADLEENVGIRGMARLRIDLAEDATSPHYTQLFGWDTVDSAFGLQTCSYPYARMSVFSGSLVVGGYNVVAGSFPAAGADAAIVAETEYYLEFIEGIFAGHRFDLLESGTTSTQIALDLASPSNTLSPVPVGLAGSFAIRPAMTLRELVDPQFAMSSDDSDAGDGVYSFDGSNWKSFWVYDESGNIPAQWTDVADEDLLDAGDTVIGPSGGIFLKTSGSYLPVTRVGIVREWPFACPLNSGFNLIGGGFPIDQSPESRAMSRDDGDGFQDWFTASNDPLLADQLSFWLGDQFPGAHGYQTYFRVYLGVPEYDHWADQSNSFLTNADDALIFQRGRAAMCRSIDGHDRAVLDDVWRWPVPWVGDSP